MDLAEQVVGHSPPIVALRATIERLLRSTIQGSRPPSVLLQGETGTGKGLIASILHRQSRRRDARFVDVNCAAIPEPLLEAELFGYERGAFTDARRSKPGLFQVAHGGTLFLDEVGLLPPAMQAKLLTVLEERSVRRLGGTQKEPADVWVLSATNVDLAAEVRARRFREDLYHRLAVVTLRMPPLRDRGDDVILLADRFLVRARADYGLPELTLDGDARARLRAYGWPGNVRELANVIERAAVLGDSQRITAAALGLSGGDEAPESPVRVGGAPGVRTQDELLREHLQDALKATGGNITRTAGLLGVTRATVRAQMRRFGLRPDVTTALDPARRASAVASSTEGRAVETAQSPPPTARPARGPVVLRWEYRRAAILRAALQTDTAEAWREGGRVLQMILEKVRGFGGRVEGLGPLIVEAVFGVEPFEEGPRRAAHAGLAILREMERMREQDPALLAPRMAIHADRALAGRVGGSVHLDSESKHGLSQAASALGERAGPGEILVSGSAAAFLERHFTLAPIDAGPVRCLIGHERSGRGLWGTPSRFVGRDDEMKLFRSRAAAAQQGRGQVVAVSGDAGVGKSRLIWEFTRGVGPGWRLVEATCAGGGRTLYHLAAELLRAFFNVGWDEAPVAVRFKIEAALLGLDERVRATAPALLTVLGVSTDDPRWERLDPAARRPEILDSIRSLVIGAARIQPLLVAVEDVHWIDAESEAVLKTIASSLAAERILLLLSYRPEYQDACARLGPCTRLHLDPLPAGHASLLLDALLGEDPTLVALKQLMVDWTQGNPFFLEETVRALVESGALEGPRGSYRLRRPVSRLEVPATVEELLAARIDGLASVDRSLLQTAATIGAVVPLTILQRVTESDEASLRAGCRRLCAAELLVERGGAGSRDVAFRHPLTQEVARLSLLPAARRDLHARVFSVMESAYPNPAGDQIDRLAQHAVAGQVWDKAVVYSRQAGDRALRSFATMNAVESFDHALVALRHLGESRDTLIQAVDLHLRLRDALWPLGRLQEMLDHLREADTLASSAGDSRRQGWIACYLAQYHWSVAENERALEAGKRASAIADGLNDPALTAETSFYVGITQLALGDYREASRTLTAAVPILDRAVEARESSFPSPRFAISGPALLRGWLARSLGELGQFPEGRAFGEEGIRMAAASHSPFGIIAAAAGLGNLYLRKGEPARAIPPLEQAMDLCRKYGFQNWVPTVTANLGLTYVGIGRMAEGISLLEQSAEVTERTRIGATATLWRIYLGEAYLRDGRLAQSADVARQALALSRARKEGGHEARAEWLLGEIEARAARPDLERAESAYRAALDLAEEREMRPLMASCHLGLARLYARAVRPEAELHRDRARALAAQLEMVLDQAEGPG